MRLLRVSVAAAKMMQPTTTAMAVATSTSAPMVRKGRDPAAGQALWNVPEEALWNAPDEALGNAPDEAA